MKQHRVSPLIVLAVWIAHAQVTAAYVGPGAGISVIGTAVAFVGSVVFAILGFVWYPIKRLIAMLRSHSESEHNEADQAS
jgi:uncharacterized membrane protein